MSKFLSGALRAIFEDGNHSRELIRTIGKLAFRKPAVVSETITLPRPESRYVYQWQVSFPTEAEAVQFDWAIRACISAAAKEEE
jgi:hypothetical protein